MKLKKRIQPQRIQYKCLRCNWMWFGRRKEPKVCPYCKSAWWNEKRKEAK